MAPPGASPEVRAYVSAANAAVPGWQKVSNDLNAQGGRVLLKNVSDETAVDNSYLRRVDAIHFTGSAAKPASDFRRAVHSYVSILLDVLRHPRPIERTAAHQLLDQAGKASAELRSALGLPPGSCQFGAP